MNMRKNKPGNWRWAVSLSLCLCLCQEVSAQEQPYRALKTNLVAWAGTVVNLAAEVQVGRRVSIEIPFLWCPWYVGSQHAVRTLTLQPEVRWWTVCPGKGHFMGAHVHICWFNVRWGNYRYQDASRPILGAGISYGYLLPLGGRWAGEFTIGAGYAGMRYDTFYNIDNGAYIDSRTYHYWGITRLGVSVVYCFK